MFVRFLAILVIVAQGLDAAKLKCFNCGYMRKVEGEMAELPDTPFCNDFATPHDLETECPEGDCCAVVREYFTRKDEDTLNATYTQEIGRHGCESALDKYTSSYKIECPEGQNGKTCQQFTEDLPTRNGTIVDNAEVCFCNSDRCNDQDPMIEPTTPKSGVTSIIPSLLLTLVLLALLDLYKCR